MNQFGETPSIYVWPKGHEEGEAFPEDFWERVGKGLESVGIAWENA